jgi:dihydroxyacetone kinase-like predicted kinase
MLRGLLGETGTRAVTLGEIGASWLSATRRAHEGGAQSGFCTEFIVQGKGLDADAIRSRLDQMGDSLLVVGDDSLARVHIHTTTPDDVFAYARTLGDVSREKVEDMEAQFQELAAPERPATIREGLGVVAVGAGAGIEALFRSLGAAVVVRGGQTMNPSAGDILSAISACGTASVIVLPNNKNVVLAAEQASKSGRAGVEARVVPTRSIPQGVAALIAMNTEDSVDENATAMTEAIANVRAGEVTLAARSTTIQDLDVREGQPIALIDGDLALAGDSVDDVAYACAERMLEGRTGAILTLFVGEGTAIEAAGTLADRLRTAFACEVEVVDGGQPHYPYLIGVE